MKGNRLSVLIIAHELSPVQGSECAVGWNLVTRLAKYHDLTVLYASGSQANHNSYFDAINNYTAVNGPIPGIRFINIDQPGITKSIASFNKTFSKIGPIGLPVLYYLGYGYWQKAAFAKAKELHKKEKFDVVHQLTQVAFREPGYTWKMDIPFFWGPTGGTKTLPKAFYKMLPLKSRILEGIRTFSNYIQFNFSSRVIKANKTAAVIYAFSPEDVNLLKQRVTGEIKLMLDVGTIHYDSIDHHSDQHSTTVKAMWCGHLIERKAAIILLKALALSKQTREGVKFQIVGTGPLEESLQQFAEELELKNVEWIKNVDRDTVFKMMSEADFFVHTSLREATSSVIPEALSTGLPVICHDADGMSIAINESCGIKVPMISPADSIIGFHAAIEKLVLNKPLIEKLKAGARKRSLEMSWDSMAETIATDYITVVNKKAGIRP
ncbi:hypothetical protein BH11BAC4_BH11BAC4_04380 [soil metagenome]